jgi:Mn-dependent DtxR family transcriptional regulator
MEHALSERTVQHFLRFVRYVQGVPAGETACIAGFRDYLKDGTRRQCVAKSGPELRGEGAVDG